MCFEYVIEWVNVHANTEPLNLPQSNHLVVYYKNHGARFSLAVSNEIRLRLELNSRINRVDFVVTNDCDSRKT